MDKCTAHSEYPNLNWEFLWHFATYGHLPIYGKFCTQYYVTCQKKGLETGYTEYARLHVKRNVHGMFIFISCINSLVRILIFGIRAKKFIKRYFVNVKIVIEIHSSESNY